MKFKQSILICVVTLMLTGCGSVSALIVCTPKPYIEHPQSIKLDYYDDPGWWDYKNLSLVRQRIKDYLNKENSIDADVKNSLEALTFHNGMTKEQIVLVIGEPVKKKILKDNNEQWTYSGAKGGVMQWYYRWGKLKFFDGKLVD